MTPVELIRRAASHLNEVGLKKGAWSNADRRNFDKNRSPVCGIGALKWVITGNPWATPGVRGRASTVFVKAWSCMNEATIEIDSTIPPGSDAFIMYNDDEGTSKQDVLLVMKRAAQLADTIS